MAALQTLADRRFEMVRRFETSGLSARAFAREEGVSLGTLATWRKRAASRASSRHQSEFVAVQVIGDIGGLESHIADVLLKGGRRLRVPDRFNADEIARLVKVLESC